MKQEITNRALNYMRTLVGMDYSKTYRYRWYNGGSTDCSGYVYAAYLAAGFPLRGKRIQSMTSMYEVYADGFELLFPASYADIGKRFADKGFYKTFAFAPGDLIFYSFGTTTRPNKITHVAMCYDAGHIIHTANNRDKACIKDISYGDGSIVAVIRLKEGAEEMDREQIRKGGKEAILIRRMQCLLNLSGTKLECDGVWGSKTEAALRDFQRRQGLTVDGVCGNKTWAALVGQIEPGADTGGTEGTGLDYNFVRNLKNGMRGEDVKALQQLLAARGYSAGTADGIFGSKTRAAVKAAQKAVRVTVDGVAGRNTITALGGVWGLSPKNELTICSWNIKRGTYKKGTYKIVGNIVKDADIVGLQEITPAGLAKIATYAGKTGHMCETISGYGHAVLTNYGVDKEEILTLSGGGERRKVHHLLIGRVSYYNTHFHYTQSANNTQLKELVAILKRDDSEIVIVTGDFNRQDYAALTALGFRQANTGQRIRNTEGGGSIVNKIDQVFVRGALVADVWKYEAVQHKYSDHDALYVKVRI